MLNCTVGKTKCTYHLLMADSPHCCGKVTRGVERSLGVCSAVKGPGGGAITQKQTSSRGGSRRQIKVTSAKEQKCTQRAEPCCGFRWTRTANTLWPNLHSRAGTVTFIIASTSPNPVTLKWGTSFSVNKVQQGLSSCTASKIWRCIWKNINWISFLRINKVFLYCIVLSHKSFRQIQACMDHLPWVHTNVTQK